MSIESSNDEVSEMALLVCALALSMSNDRLLQVARDLDSLQSLITLFEQV